MREKPEAIHSRDMTFIRPASPCLRCLFYFLTERG